MGTTFVFGWIKLWAHYPSNKVVPSICIACAFSIMITLSWERRIWMHGWKKTKGTSLKFYTLSSSLHLLRKRKLKRHAHWCGIWYNVVLTRAAERPVFFKPAISWKGTMLARVWRRERQQWEEISLANVCMRRVCSPEINQAPWSDEEGMVNRQRGLNMLAQFLRASTGCPRPLTGCTGRRSL